MFSNFGVKGEVLIQFMLHMFGPQTVEEGEEEKFPLAPMGVLAPGSAHARPSARPPIDTSGNFPANVSA